MKTIKNEQELIEIVKRENYYFRDGFFESYRDLKKEAEQHFSSITQEFEDQEDYYSHFGLEAGEVHINKVKEDRYYSEESNTWMYVEFYEAYIDSGVPAEDYFYGFLIEER